MKSGTNKTAGLITYNAYLIVTERGNLRVVRHTPKLDRGERSIAMTVNIPVSFFRVPSIRAVISLPQDSGAPVISMETIASMEEVLKAGTGADFSISVSS